MGDGSGVGSAVGPWGFLSVLLEVKVVSIGIGAKRRAGFVVLGGGGGASRISMSSTCTEASLVFLVVGVGIAVSAADPDAGGWGCVTDVADPWAEFASAFLLDDEVLTVSSTSWGAKRRRGFGAGTSHMGSSSPVAIVRGYM